MEPPQSNTATGTISAAYTGPPPGTGLWNQGNSTSTNESASTSSPSTARTWNTADTNTHPAVPENEPLWTTVVQNRTQRTQLLDNRQQHSNARRGPDLHGASGENRLGQARSLSADVDIVAYNFGKNVTAVDVSNWLATKGVEVKDCKLLTTSDEARSLTFKITIKPEDYDRATQDAMLWPYRVGVRLFKSSNKRNQNQNRNEHPGGRDHGRYDRNGGYTGRNRNGRY